MKPGPSSKTRTPVVTSTGNGKPRSVSEDEEDEKNSKVKNSQKPVSKKASKLDSSSEEEVNKVKSDQDSEEEEDFEEFTVEQILDKKIAYSGRGRARKEKITYFLSWKGFDKLDI